MGGCNSEFIAETSQDPLMRSATLLEMAQVVGSMAMTGSDASSSLRSLSLSQMTSAPWRWRFRRGEVFVNVRSRKKTKAHLDG